MLVDDSLGDSNLWNIKFSSNVAEVYGTNLAEFPQSLSIQTVLGNTLPVTTYLNYSGDRNILGDVKDSTVLIKDIVTITNYTIKGYPGIATNLILPSG